MKKKLLTVLLILINAACIFILSETSLFQNKKQPVYIAVAGPMSGANKTEGEAMLRGIRLYLDKINNEKKIGDRKIKLIIFDDKNDKRVAMKVASQIADDNKV
ncbi:MAG TPA: ABC transporter substrate-binding protein, partial [Desulfobacterales bacterium]|nr:ABC transporter substrate-binding protein [Desulfobacterales bacterium]